MMTSTAPNLTQLFARAGISPLDGGRVPDLPVVALTDDSRDAAAGCCFVAVCGATSDGHAFIGDAVERGATCVICEQQLVVPCGVPVVRVGDSREALAKLAAAFYGLRGNTSTELPLVGITGTNGKTTVAWLLRAVLNDARRRAALIGTIEYDLVSRRIKAPLTTPGSLELSCLLAEARDAGARCGLLEVSSHALQQRRCDGLFFAATVFTNLSGDHLDYHGSMDAYFDAKRRLFDLRDSGGAAIINIDDPRGLELARGCPPPVIGYGLTESADVAGAIESMDRKGTTLRIRSGAFDKTVRVSLVGQHNASNVLAVFAAARALGLDAESIAGGLERVKGVPGRLERIEDRGRPFSIFVDYAHTDDALRNALSAVKPITEGRLLCVFGCGGDRDRSKRPRMARAAADIADVTIVTSDNPRTEDPQMIIDDIVPGFIGHDGCAVEVQPDRRAAIALAIGMVREGDTIVIAGKGHEDYQLVGERILPFDDAQVARELLLGNGVAEEVA